MCGESPCSSRAARLIGGFHGAADSRVQVQVTAHAADNCSPWMLGRLLELGAGDKKRGRASGPFYDSD